MNNLTMHHKMKTKIKHEQDNHCFTTSFEVWKYSDRKLVSNKFVQRIPLTFSVFSAQHLHFKVEC